MPTFTQGNMSLVYGPVNNVIQTQQILVGTTDILYVISSAFNGAGIGINLTIPNQVKVLTESGFDLICAAINARIDPFVCSSAADKLFGSFGIWETLRLQGYQLAATDLWKQVLAWTEAYETTHNAHVHKGTPLFFYGACFLLQGDVDAGFHYVYNAMEEDKALAVAIGRPPRFKESPAYMTARIVNDNRNALHGLVVIPSRDTISKLIQSFQLANPSYHTSVGSAFTMQDFETQFLSEPSLQQVVFFFTYNLYNHVTRNRFGAMQNNDFMKLKNANSFFNIGVVIEEVLKHRFPGGTHHYISDGICQLASERGWIPRGEGKDQFLSKLSGVMLSQSPSVTIPILINGSPLYAGQPLRTEMRYLLLAWHLRNHAGHNIQAQNLFVQMYDKIFEWLTFALFLSVV